MFEDIPLPTSKIVLEAADGSWSRPIYGDTDDVIHAIELGLSSCKRGFNLSNYEITNKPMIRGNYSRSLLNETTLKSILMDRGRFRSCKFFNCKLFGCHLNGTNFEGSEFVRCGFYDIIGNSANFGSSTFRDCTFARCLLNRAKFDGADMGETRFVSVDMKKGNWIGCTFANAEFRDCVLDGVIYAPRNITWEDAEDWVDGISG